MKIVLLGAGLSGLTAARILSKYHDVSIIEQAPFVGGLASSFEINGEEIPKFYHHVIEPDEFSKREFKRLNLFNNQKWEKIKVNIGSEGRLHNIQNPFDLMSINGTSLWSKFRFGIFGLYSIFLMNPSKVPEEMSALEWLNIYCGKSATNFFWENLYARNKFGIPLNEISAKQLAHRLSEKEVYNKFTYPEYGFQPMCDAIKEECINQGVKINLSTSTRSIDFKNNFIEFESGDTLEFDILVNSIPAPEFLKLAKNLPKEYNAQLSNIRYCPAVGLCFATKEFLKEGIYWINIFGESVQVVMQHSVLADRYENKVSWAIRYGGSDQDIIKNEDEIRETYISDLNKYFGNVEPIWLKVFKERYASPIYDINYKNYVPTYQTPLENLYMTGIQVTFPKIRSTSTAIESGYKVAEIVNSRISKANSIN